MPIRKCIRCSWTFEFTHTNRCPQCGAGSVEHAEINQRDWKKFQRKQYECLLDNVANQVQCCWTAKHSNGWHHDPKCPNQSIVD